MFTLKAKRAAAAICALLTLTAGAVFTSTASAAGGVMAGPNMGTIKIQANQPEVTKGSSLGYSVKMYMVPGNFGNLPPEYAKDTKDNTRIQLQVWYSTDKPSTKETPTPDANHRLVGTYNYDIKDVVAQAPYSGSDYPVDLNFKVLDGENGIANLRGKHPVRKAGHSGYYTAVVKYNYTGTDRVWFYDDDWSQPITQTAYNMEGATIKSVA